MEDKGLPILQVNTMAADDVGIILRQGISSNYTDLDIDLE